MMKRQRVPIAVASPFIIHHSASSFSVRLCGFSWHLGASFIRNPITGKNLDDVLGGPHHWGHIERHMHSSRNEALLVNVATGKANREHRTNEGDRLKKF